MRWGAWLTRPDPYLVVFSGLPGTGKTVIAKGLAGALGLVYLRIDTIEQALIRAGIEQVGAAGYAVANALAEESLRLGRSVVADCVNPVRESRIGWRAVAERASARLVEIQFICSDRAEHRRRVEARLPDIPGHVLPGWDAVLAHEFEPRDDDCLVLDTARLSVMESVERCVGYVRLG